MSDDKITMLCEQFQNHQTGETVEGITVMIEGRFKQMLDIFMHKKAHMRIILSYLKILFLRA